MAVVIDGVVYLPVTEIKQSTDKVINEVLEVLTEMRYFKQSHKMSALAWNAINVISPDLAKMEAGKAYYFVHGEDNE